jgi:hypothetical protein
MRFVPKYLQALGATVFIIGLYDALRTLVGAIYAYPGGVLVDHWRYRQAFIIFNVVSIVGCVFVLLIPHWAAVIAGMFFFLSWSCFSLPATFSLVGAVLEANRLSMGVGSNGDQTFAGQIWITVTAADRVTRPAVMPDSIGR